MVAADSHDDASLEEIALDSGGPAALADWLDLRAHLARRGLIAWTADAAGRDLARLVPTSPAFAGPVAAVATRAGPTPAPDVAPIATARLSRFAHLRAENGLAIAHSPFGHARVELLHPAAAVLFHRLAAGVDIAGLGSAGLALLGLFASAGLLEGSAGDPPRKVARYWDFEDALLFGRTRLERLDAPRGATFRFRGEPPLPAARPSPPGPAIPLTRPEPAAEQADARTLIGALEARRSRRAHGDPPITRNQLAELLYRAVSARGERQAAGDRGDGGDVPRRIEDNRDNNLHVSPRLIGEGDEAYETSRRAYPGGGACHPLDIHPLVTRCNGLDAGLYAYDAHAHLLVRIDAPADSIGRLLAPARANMHDGAAPQVLLIISARFRRLSWKYEGIALSLLLAEVGALYQTLYLVAESMGLAGCALGAGDAETFSALIGRPLAEESSVGEFMVGSRVG